MNRRKFLGYLGTGAAALAAASAGLGTLATTAEAAPADNKTFQVRKHTALGRFHHENTAMGLSKNGRVVVYMGDDKKDACVFKYVSNGQFDKAAGRNNSKLLENGTLYGANFKKGTWS